MADGPSPVATLSHRPCRLRVIVYS